MTLRYLRAVTLTLLWETDRYTDRPNDRGGPTKYGITQRFLRAVYGTEKAPHPRDLTLEDALRIYHEQFWQRLRADEFEREDVASKVFDMAVNMGEGNAVLYLQRALNTVLDDLVPLLTVDGRIGSKTIAAANHPAAKTAAVMERLIALQGAFYHRLVAGDATQAENSGGWARRAAFDPRKFHV